MFCHIATEYNASYDKSKPELLSELWTADRAGSRFESAFDSFQTISNFARILTFDQNADSFQVTIASMR